MLRKTQQKLGYKCRRHMLTTRLTQQSHEGQFLTTTEAYCSYRNEASLPRQTRPASPLQTPRDSRFTATATPDSMLRTLLLMHLLFDDATPSLRPRLHGGMGLCSPPSLLRLRRCSTKSIKTYLETTMTPTCTLSAASANTTSSSHVFQQARWAPTLPPQSQSR
jgi:hypothetical protein